MNTTRKLNKAQIVELMSSSHEDKINIFKHGVSNKSIDLNEHEFELWFHVINDNGNLKDWITILIDCGIDINAKDGEGDTALILASLKGNKDIVELLIHHNADINAQTKYGDTALIWALREGNKDFIELLQNTTPLQSLIESYNKLKI